MSNSLYVVAAIAMGACLSVQPPINAAMARVLDSPLLSACISIAISFALMTTILLVSRQSMPDATQFKALPWWIIFGGIIGVIFVAGSLVVAPVLGVAPFFIFVVAGQLLGSTVIDQLGAFSMDVRPVSLLKLAGLAMVVVGAALVQTSDTAG